MLNYDQAHLVRDKKSKSPAREEKFDAVLDKYVGATEHLYNFFNEKQSTFRSLKSFSS